MPPDVPVYASKNTAFGDKEESICLREKLARIAAKISDINIFVKLKYVLVIGLTVKFLYK